MQRSLAAAASGVAAGAAAIGVGELVASVLNASASPLLSVGSFVIDLTPGFLKSAVIAAFGTGDKPFLIAVLLVLVTVLGAISGVAQLRRPPLGVGLVLFAGVVASFAAATRKSAQLLDITPSVIAGVAGALVLSSLVGRIVRADPDPSGSPDPSRRSALIVAGVWAGIGLAAGIASQVIGASSRRVATAIRSIRLPKPTVPLSAIPAATQLQVPGLSPLITPNPDFYRIDIALSVPQLVPETWRLQITGEVQHPFSITYQELLAMPMTEGRLTLMCVSNEVGGDLISTATWLGVPIRDLLAKAAPRAGADMVLSSGADGFTASTPLSTLTDGRNALFAVGMNGAVLPQLHGFPVRMVVPGLYGYVSATKWLTTLKVTRFDRATSYWTDRGWSPRGPIKLSSRIDVPAGGVQAGPVTVAGVAWAQHTGIARVEVRADDGPWRDATLAEELTVDVWRQWRYTWMATKGTHSLQVRATDRDGLVQTSRITGEVPNGSTGLHTVQIAVG